MQMRKEVYKEVSKDLIPLWSVIMVFSVVWLVVILVNLRESISRMLNGMVESDVIKAQLSIMIPLIGLPIVVFIVTFVVRLRYKKKLSSI